MNFACVENFSDNRRGKKSEITVNNFCYPAAMQVSDLVK